MATIAELKQGLTFEARLCHHRFIFHSTWGLFSPKSIDEGTQLLAGKLELPSDAIVLDLGCGYGPLGLAAAVLAPQGQIHMVDKDFVAVALATKNVSANHLTNATAYLSDGFAQVPPGTRFDAIISNVPAKIGTELLQIFLSDAYDHLKPCGQINLVVISGLKDYMKRHLTNYFGSYEILGRSKTYTALRATKP